MKEQREIHISHDNLLQRLQKEGGFDSAENHKVELRLLSRFSGQVNAFGTNETDEFRVQREGGVVQGIFKTWAVPVIPFLEVGRLDILDRLWEPIHQAALNGVAFEESLEQLSSSESQILKQQATEAKNILQEWERKILSRPACLKESLERVRVQSWIIDRRLTELFRKERLPEDVAQRIGLLTDRLSLALGFLSPFYNLEALIADPKGFHWNPVLKAEAALEEDVIGGGRLDLFAQLLPSALQEFIDADQLDWHGLTWDTIRQRSREIIEVGGVQSHLLFEVASLTQSNVAHVVFALNVLEWIPKIVGGKKTDLPKDQAVRHLTEVSDMRSEGKNARIVKITRDINALIRFLNWFPIIVSEANIMEERDWTYASVCDTADQLLDTLVQHPEVWEGDFADIFSNHLLPQIRNLDATSAKGRFLLSLFLTEGRLKPEFSQFVDDENRREQIISNLSEARIREWVLPLGNGLKPRMVVGGKSFGLEEVIGNFHLDLQIPPGFSLTSEAIEDLLKGNIELWNLIISLERETDLQDQLLLRKTIREKLSDIRFSEQLKSILRDELKKIDRNGKFAVRSSSFDEDMHDGESAAGIYETVLNVNQSEIENAIKECIASFFSEKALQFRKLHGLSHIPNFAILIQPFIEGKGGTAFSKNLHGEENVCIIDVADHPSIVSSGDSQFSEFQIANDGTVNLIKGADVIDQITLLKVNETVKSIQRKTGRSVDLEWIQDNEGLIWVLQVRTLPTEGTIRESARKIDFEILLEPHDSLENLDRDLKSKEGFCSIIMKGRRNLDAFQGELFRIITIHGKRIAEILHEEEIPLTSHFANICASLGIRLKKMEVKNA